MTLNIRSKIARTVLGYFMLHQNAESYVNGLARRLSLDSGNLTRKLIELEKEGILKSRWQGSERYYSLNTSFPLLKEYRRIILKTVGFEHALRQSLAAIQGLKKAVVFGSYARDKMDAASDIDLLVIGQHNVVDLHRAIATIQKTADRHLNVVSMSEEEYRRKKNKDLFLRSIEQKPKIKII